MNVRIHLVGMCCAMLVTGASAAFAQQYPTKPVRIIASGVGGAGDFSARVIANGMTGRLGQPVIVENRPGGLVPGEIVARAQPDGHTLMLVGSVIWLSPYMRDSMPFDPVRDFAPITLAVTQPNVIVVFPGLPVKSVKELIALAKEKPGVLNYASSGTGNSTHLAGELFKAKAGVNIVQVNYKGTTLALNDVIAGRVEVMFAAASGAAPYLSTGRLRGLAVASAKPSELAPGLPTAAASGLPGYESGSILGVFANAATPKSVTDLLNSEILRFLNTQEVRTRFFTAGMEVVGSSPAQFAAVIKEDMAQTGKVIRAAGIRLDD